MTNVEIYIDLVKTVLEYGFDENIDALDAFEAANPGIEDEVYKAGGPYGYDFLNGVLEELGYTSG